MQAIIMAAGKGSRLGGLTQGKPKAFAEINGRKLIEYNICLLKKYHIDEIIIVTGFQSEAFEDLLKDEETVHFVYNPFYELMNVLGSFYMGMDRLHDDFIYMHADTLCEPSVFEKMICLDADVVLPVEYKVCDDEEAMKVHSENGKIVQISKQIPNAMAEGEFIGMAAFRRKVLPALKAKTRQLMKERAFSDYFEGAIQRLIDEENFDIRAVSMENAFWTEIDFIEDYEKAVREIPESMTGIFE